MKKVCSLLIFAILLANCGSDDSGSSSLKPIAISVTQNGNTDVKTLVYDSRNRIQNLISEGIPVTFTYNSRNRVDRLASGADFLQFTYGSDNQLVSFVDANGNTTTVTSLGNNSYNIGGTLVELTPDGDLTRFNAATLTHGTSKGAFANVKAFDALFLYFADTSSYLYAAKKRTTGVLSNNNYTLTYTEGESGLPATAATTPDLATLAFTYSN